MFSLKIRSILAAIALLGPLSIAEAGDEEFQLTSASITFDTPADNDNKDHDTSVTVEVSAKKGKSTKIIAKREAFAGNEKYPDPSTKTVDIPIVEKIRYDEMNLLGCSITINPNGNDRWIFGYTLTLTFQNQDNKTTKTATQKVSGIILDQGNRTRLTETWVRFPQHALKHKLTDAEIVFVTPANNDNKDRDTSIDVELTYPLDEKTDIRAASKLGFAGDTDFPDDGSSREFQLTLNSPMVLEQFASSSLRIESHPNGNDRWVFGFNLSLRFEGEGDPVEITVNRSGIILDQDNRIFRIDP